ncbi:MAG: hypothetical protein KKD44_25770 [Proteobacteria bacterium]|nr:hypothetical protein [Pseudomonadota bacterium]
MNKWLPEQLKTIRNLEHIAALIMLHEEEVIELLLPTVLEYMLEVVQQIGDENCVKR